MVDQNDVSEESVEGLRDDSVGGAVDDNVGGGQPVGCGEVHVDDNTTHEQNVDDNATHGQTVGSEDVHVDEPDWLDEGYEGLDYLDNIFGTQNNEVPNMREYQRDTENVNEGNGVREPVTDNGKRPKAGASD